MLKEEPEVTTTVHNSTLQDRPGQLEVWLCVSTFKEDLLPPTESFEGALIENLTVDGSFDVELSFVPNKS